MNHEIEHIMECLQTPGELDGQELENLTALFAAFSDTTRVRIMKVLMEGEICVGDLAQSLEMTQSAVSHQLKVLKQARLVKGRREGKQILYSLDDDHVFLILAAGVQHIKEE